MREKDFKEIWFLHIESCREIVKQKGRCKEVDCDICSFTTTNTVLDMLIDG